MTFGASRLSHAQSNLRFAAVSIAALYCHMCGSAEACLHLQVCSSAGAQREIIPAVCQPLLDGRSHPLPGTDHVRPFALKHARQQAAILGQLQAHGLLQVCTGAALQLQHPCIPPPTQQDLPILRSSHAEQMSSSMHPQHRASRYSVMELSQINYSACTGTSSWLPPALLI